MSTPHPEFVHRFEAAPDKTSPGSGVTLLLLHGTGGSENDLLGIGRSVAPQSALLSPRGKILENGMPRFFRRLREGVFDEADLVARTHELADFVASASQVYGFDASRVVALGYSNGANIAASTLFLRPGILAGAILLRPMVPLVPAEKPDLQGAPIFVVAGQRDGIVPVENTQRLVEMLRDFGAGVTLRFHTGGHELSREELLHAQSWLAEYFASDNKGSDAI